MAEARALPPGRKVRIKSGDYEGHIATMLDNNPIPDGQPNARKVLVSIDDVFSVDDLPFHTYMLPRLLENVMDRSEFDEAALTTTEHGHLVEPEPITDPMDPRLDRFRPPESVVKHYISRQVPGGYTDVDFFLGVRDQRDSTGHSPNIALVGETQSGKQAPVSTPVLTPSGWSTMGALNVGDQVIGSSGYPINVTGVFPQDDRRVLRITFSDGSSTRCGHDHLWAVRTKVQKNRGKDFQVLTTDQITNLGRGWQIPIVAPVQFPEANLLVDPYTLGVLLGDGSLSQRTIQLTTDAEIAEALPYPCTDRGHRSEGIVQAYVGGGIAAELRELGLLEVHSHEKFVPAQYLIGSVEQRLALLQGLLDTDGYAIPGGSVEFSSTSAMLIDGVEELVRSLGGITHARKRAQAQYTYKGERRQGKPAWRLLCKLPAGIAPFRLTRKAEAYQAPTKFPPCRTIVSIEPEGDEDSVCIMVDAPDHLYVTEDYIVTHNTMLVQVLAVMAARRDGMPKPYPVITLNGSNSITSYDVYGQTQAVLIDGKETLVWMEGVAPIAARIKGCIFYLDEWNAVPPGQGVGIHPMLDWRHQFVNYQKAVPDGAGGFAPEVVKVEPECWIISTINPNYKGTQTLAEATSNRFKWYPWDYDAETEKKLIVSKSVRLIGAKLRDARVRNQLTVPIGTSVLQRFCADCAMFGVENAMWSFKGLFPAVEQDRIDMILGDGTGLVDLLKEEYPRPKFMVNEPTHAPVLGSNWN